MKTKKSPFLAANILPLLLAFPSYGFAEELIDVNLQTVDTSGSALAGQVFSCTEGLGITPHEWHPSQQTLNMADGATVCLGGQFYDGGLYVGRTLEVTVQQGHTYTIDTRTGDLISDESTPGATGVLFAFDFQYASLVVDTVDASGGHLPGRLHVRTSGLGVEPYGDDPAPLQLRIAEGGTINLHGSYCDAGLCVGQDAD
ncbi:MAG: hypothetical protein ABII00_04735, partial [Elusimicrobiota bacterium]